MAARQKAQVVACETPCESFTRLDKQVNGNGQPGIRQELQMLAAECHEFFTKRTAAEAAEQRFRDLRGEEIKEAALLAAAHVKADLDARHERADKSDRIFRWGMAIAGLIITIFMAWIGWREYERKTSTVTSPAPIAHSTPTTQTATE